MMSEDTNDFWQSHSLKYLEMAFRTDRCEILAAPDGYGEKTGVCGDTIEIFLKTRGETIEYRLVSYQRVHEYHWPAPIRLPFSPKENRLAKLGKSPLKPSPNYLETLPEDHFHCAELAVGALYLALSNYNELQRSPWKKSYQTRSKN